MQTRSSLHPKESLLFCLFLVGSAAALHGCSDELPWDDDARGSAVEVAVGGEHACARLTDGTVYCWGMNDRGQAGQPTTDTPIAPTKVPNLTNVVELALGNAHSCARTSSGEVSCWGANDLGQLGDGTTEDRANVALAGVPTNATELQANGDATCASTPSGHYCWGSGWLLNGGLVSGLTRAHPRPFPMATTRVWLGAAHLCTDRGGEMSCNDGYYDRGDASGMRRLGVRATLVPGYDFACSLAGGSVSCAGANDRGQLGDGTLEERTDVRAVVAVPAGVEQIAAQRYACALASDGAVWCWGAVGYTLGAEDEENAPTPRQLARVHDATSIALSSDFGCAVRRTGAVACWGSTMRGERGNRNFGQEYTLHHAQPTNVPLP